MRGPQRKQKQTTLNGFFKQPTNNQAYHRDQVGSADFQRQSSPFPGSLRTNPFVVRDLATTSNSSNIIRASERNTRYSSPEISISHTSTSAAHFSPDLQPPKHNRIVSQQVTIKTSNNITSATVPQMNTVKQRDGIRKRKLPSDWESNREKRLGDYSSTSTNRNGASSATPSSHITTDHQGNNVNLSEEQEGVLKAVINGESVFFTGSAGTGKSVLLRAIVKNLKSKYRNRPEAVAVTASTGMAACNIGGCTVHSFAGIGLGNGTIDQIISRVIKNRKSAERWRALEVLIIDEISMLSADLFDKLEGVARAVRRSNKPFGGIQLVITGDFYQLPPISDNGKEVKFTFEARTWKDCIQRTMHLQNIFRQRDNEFVKMLNDIREGRLSETTLRKFRELSRPLKHANGDIECAQLYARRDQVDKANSERLASLSGQLHIFQAEDSGDVAKLESGCMAPKMLQLKLHAQVMLLKNLDNTLVNGSLGIVVGFVGEGEYRYLAGQLSESNRKNQDTSIQDVNKPYPIVKFANGREIMVLPEEWKLELPGGEVIAQRIQIPLLLAWSMSIHKSQGQTLDLVKVDLGGVFEKGQAYVALSRATSLDGLQVLNFNPQHVMAHPVVVKYYTELKSA
ncbi:uncharacterized protein VTP21DRAFT_5452 [Calcarisporiella thermophila]|uniref:uncharacterized protein n=1 Tax=Calcarisporiella thermophila TaxID=911321 RepID=UPI00374216D2